MIPVELYKNIIDVISILCVDIIIQNSQHEYLLVKRKNEPLKGKWWIVGGRILKGETVEQAAIRKVKEELSIDIKKLKLIVFFEAPFQKHPFGLKEKYHAVRIVLSAYITNDNQIKLDSQSSEWKFSKKLPSQFVIKTFSNFELSTI